MFNIKDSSIQFECSYCGNIWTCKKSRYKMRTTKTLGGKRWKQYISVCPECGRETTVTIEDDEDERMK